MLFNNFLMKKKESNISIADTYTYDKYPDNNFSDLPFLFVKKAFHNYNRKSYLKFNVSIANKLIMYCYSQGECDLYIKTPQTLRINLINEIDINAITWNNANTLITSRENICELSLNGTYCPDDPIEFIFTKNISGVVYLEIEQLPDGNKNFVVNSLENSSDLKPKLVIDMG